MKFSLPQTELQSDVCPCAVTVGFFDGVHIGHLYLINYLNEVALRENLTTVVATFDHHPRLILDKNFTPCFLTTFKEKQALLLNAGIDKCIALPFDNDMANMSAERFMREILFDQLRARILIVGYDNRFGKGRKEGFENYVEYGKNMGLRVLHINALELLSNTVSSTHIRQLISDGNVSLASSLLGYRYMLTGTVVHGQGIGRQLGFPTANILPENTYKIIPGVGVYAANLTIDGCDSVYVAMVNIGTKPTFGGSPLTIEAHILHFSGDIYGRRVTLFFDNKLRNERRFISNSDLSRQLKNDASEVLRILS